MLAAKYSFFRIYILSKAGMIKPTKDLVIIVGSLSTSRSLRKNCVEVQIDVIQPPPPVRLPFHFDGTTSLSANVKIECLLITPFVK